MVDAADCPDDGVGSACDLAVDKPDTGSALEDGQSPLAPLAGFFFGPHPPCSPFVVGVSPFVCGIGADGLKEVDEFDEVVEEVEFVRCAPFRGMNILVTSSALTPSMPLPEFHNGCKLGGDATAVIGVVIMVIQLCICTVRPL